MLLGILTLITALSISAVAIYYSVAGLMTIFAAAAIPIMIMGGALEIGKLVTAVWLHRYWSQATWWLKTYLTTAVLILMFITSMGIFGFLSKAHIEQTASANEGVAQLERIEAEIARNEQIIARAESKIEELETDGTGATNQIQTQIDREQERIDGAYDRIQPAIQEQNQIIAGVTQLFQQELDRIDDELARLQGFIDNNEIEKAQAMVGTAVDGDYGPNTARAFTEFQDAKRAERSEWLQRIQDAAQSPTVITAREEIARLRASAEEQIAESNALINNLRGQLKSNNGNDLQALLDEQNERVRTASVEIDLLFDQKFQLEAEYRKLEAEVGPVKYIAEFIYGETADKNLLEEAVRWVIIVIIFVFDPLAVLLLIASQYTFEFNRKRKDDDGERLRLERAEYERARAQRIVDNPGYHIDTPASPEEEKVDDDITHREAGAGHNGRNTSGGMALAGEELDVTTEKESTNDTSETTVEDVDRGAIDNGEDPGDSQRVSVEQEEDTEQVEEGIRNDLSMETTDTDADATVRDMVSEDDVSVDDATEPSVEQTQIQPNGLTTEEVARGYVNSKKKVPTVSSAELTREAEYKEKEKSEHFQISKTEWKKNNPSSTLKHYKNLYIKGVIDELPWEKTSSSDNVESEGYKQNAEQNESSLFNRIRRAEQD
jgi:hypothetical protein